MKLLLILAATALCAQAEDPDLIDQFCNGASVQPNRFDGECHWPFTSEVCMEDKIRQQCTDENDPEQCRKNTSSIRCCLQLVMCKRFGCSDFDKTQCDNCHERRGLLAAIKCRMQCRKCNNCDVTNSFCEPAPATTTTTIPKGDDVTTSS